MLVMTFATKSFASVSGAVTRVAAQGFNGVNTLVKAIIHRREVLRLGELDERGLKDLGLVRSDIEGALATSWLNDPTAILAARSSARSGVALARRDEAVRQNAAKQDAVRQTNAAARPAVPVSETTVACSA